MYSSAPAGAHTYSFIFDQAASKAAVLCVCVNLTSSLENIWQVCCATVLRSLKFHWRSFILPACIMLVACIMPNFDQSLCGCLLIINIYPWLPGYELLIGCCNCGIWPMTLVGRWQPQSHMVTAVQMLHMGWYFGTKRPCLPLD